MREKLRDLDHITLEWFIYLDAKAENQVYKQPARLLWSLFSLGKDLFFIDLKLRQEHLAHIITLNGHLHLLREIPLDVNRLNKRGESCLQIAMQN